ncbi:hypothetical protein AMTRI_Chr04g181430 [Amborella trichopoda]|uniref:ZF-HD dimerization-type domain-containing protein n=1 Tax=Amborella trichopoda TaxID=13333 RepID=W1PTK9_AMBTC|nr:zinc-finger homeodomain protein 6 [Amborella trichopoda]ERN11041.1 hypothetical protein AMTR_s00024p00085480 [Amborella trichopoda]|eukprot:XP_006849460.1 zinc-finger homeodomain protein 6 [Amborella trichopoda]
MEVALTHKRDDHPNTAIPSSSSTPHNEPMVLYKECLKNHAASLGSYATDGCGEFMESLEQSDRGGLKCAACGCHRNFHRRVPVSPKSIKREEREICFYVDEGKREQRERGDGVIRKRIRTRFSVEQKERMLWFAEKMGWRIQKDQEKEIQAFCEEIGVSRQVFKVWMHNHKGAAGNNNNASDVTQ